MMLSLENSSTSDHATRLFSVANVTSIGLESVPEGCVMKEISGAVPWNNQHNLISKQVTVIARLLVSGICTPVCFLVSFFTNLVNMVVFYKHGLKERVNMCLFTLALLDMLYIVVIYGTNASVLYMFATGQGDTISPSAVFFFKTHMIGFASFATGSQAVSTVVSLERCLCITRPLLVKNMISTKKTAICLWSFVLILVAGGFVTSGFRLKLLCVYDFRDNSYTLQYSPTQFYLQNKEIIQILDGIIFGILLPALFAICVTVSTVIIVVNLKKLSLWRKTVSSASDSLTSRDLALTRMIVGTSLLFVVCIVPVITVRIAINLIPGLNPGGRYENLYLVIVRVYYLATAINSTANFFVYYAYGSKFRQTVHQLFLSGVCCYNKIQIKSKTSG